MDFTYATGSFGGSQTATLPTTIPPLELKPQLANSYEAGISMGWLEDKIQLDLTYYQIWSYAQILDSPLPASSGANFIKINTGEIQNRGFEATLDITLLQKRISSGKQVLISAETETGSSALEMEPTFSNWQISGAERACHSRERRRRLWYHRRI